MLAMDPTTLLALDSTNFVVPAIQFVLATSRRVWRPMGRIAMLIATHKSMVIPNVCFSLACECFLIMSTYFV